MAVTTYDMLRDPTFLPGRVNVAMKTVDEAHYAKNPEGAAHQGGACVGQGNQACGLPDRHPDGNRWRSSAALSITCARRSLELSSIRRCTR